MMVRSRDLTSHSRWKICCHVPRMGPPSPTGTVIDGPSVVACTCEWPHRFVKGFVRSVSALAKHGLFLFSKVSFRIQTRIGIVVPALLVGVAAIRGRDLVHHLGQILL